MTLPGPASPALNCDTATRLSRRVAREQTDQRLPSVAAGLVRGGALVWADAAGTTDGRGGADQAVDPDTQYRIGSITKTFIAVLIMRLRDEGRLDVDDTLDDHLPGSAAGHVTLTQLLSHTSGLQAETHGPWWERTPGGGWDDLAETLAVRLPPGRRFHYSNVGFGALGEIVARYRGVSWADAVRAEILEPLGMTRTTTRPVAPHAVGLAVHPFADLVHPEPEHDAGAMAPAGQLWSTVNDLSRWATFVGGDTGDVLVAATLEEMQRPIAVVDVPGAPWTSAQGLGFGLWNVDGTRYAGHGGSMPGFLAGLRVQTGGGDGVVVFTNATSGMSGPFSADLLEIAADDPAPDTPWQTRPVPADVLELLGTWFWGPAEQVIRAGDESGWFTLGPTGAGSRTSRFRPAGDGTWVGLDGYYAGEPLRVERTESGEAYLDLASFRFTRQPYQADADIPGGVDDAGWS